MRRHLGRKKNGPALASCLSAENRSINLHRDRALCSAGLRCKGNHLHGGRSIIAGIALLLFGRGAVLHSFCGSSVSPAL